MKIIENFFNEETLKLIQECYLTNFEKGDWIHGYSFYEKKGVKQNLEIMVLKTEQLNDAVVKYLLEANDQYEMCNNMLYSIFFYN